MGRDKSDPDHIDGAAVAGREPGAEGVVCSFCSHRFSPGSLRGNMYCPKCGKRFNPYSFLDETVAINVRPSSRREDPESETSEPDAPEPSAEAEPVADDSAEEGGERFGDYDIVSEVARGGMGVVYRARQRTLKRIVALKVLRGEEGATSEDLERFMREAKAAASLSHANIVPIHELSVYKGKHFFTMDYIEGKPLDRLIDEGPLTPYQACGLVETIARAIHYAHGRGIIHRDLKPANIIIDAEGRPMLTDFGLAVNLSSGVHSHRMTRTGAVMGTIPYIPPEQAAGRVEEITARSDVYSLGAVLYEMLIGRPPFQGETQFELLRRVIHQEPVHPRKLNPKIHVDVETICLKCLEKDPARRYHSAEALAEDCRAFLHGEMIQARRASFGYRTWKKILQRKAAVGVAFSALVAAAVFVASTHGVQQETNRANRAVEEKKEIQEELATAKLEKEMVESEAKEYKEKMQRSWRQEYLAAFDKPEGFVPTRNAAPGRSWLDAGAARLDREEPGIVLKSLPGGAGLVSFGIGAPFPRDFRLECEARVAEENPGGLIFIVGADRYFRRETNSHAVILGSASHAGAKLVKGAAGETLLAELPTFQLHPADADERLEDRGWRKIEIVRDSGRLQALVDGVGVLEAQGVAADPNDGFIALGAESGEVELRNLSVSVMGLSHAMISSLLEVAGSLMLPRDSRLALELYSRVAVEDTSRDIHLRSLYGIANCLAFVNPAALSQAVDLLAREAEKSRKLEGGEKEFVTAMALSGHSVLPARREAARFFSAAVAASLPLPEDLLEAGVCHVIGPFDARGEGGFDQAFPPQDKFLPKAAYPGRLGTVAWEQLKNLPADGREYMFNVKIENGNLDQTVFFVRRVFRCEEERKVEIFTGSDDGVTVWVNGVEALRKTVARACKRDSDRTEATFAAGENVVLMKITNISGPSGFSLRVAPVMEEQHMGFYGLLSRLGAALAEARLDNPRGAADKLDALRRDGTLELLARDYADEMKTGPFLPEFLALADTSLSRNGDPHDVKTMLSALEALYPANREELAQRYQKLGKIFERGEEFVVSEACYEKALALAPKWYLPRYDFAVMLYRRGQNDRAKQILSAASAEVPDSFELHLAIARLHLSGLDSDQRDLDFANLAAQRAVQLSEGKSPQAWEIYARCLLSGGKLVEAGEAASRASELEKTPEREELLNEINRQLAPPPEAGVETPELPPAP